ncbi:MAG: HAD hydrolase-like protein [Nitrososphaerales archaeon]
MAVRALLFNFKVLAPVEIDYQRAFDLITKEYGSVLKSAPQDIFRQIALVIEEKSSPKNPDEFSKNMSSLLDVIETSQIENVPLNTGVKNGLESLEPMSVSLVAISEMGSKATETFLSDKGIKPFFDEIIAREKIGEPNDLVSRLVRALKKLGLKNEECIFFCNKTSDLKAAKSANFRTMVLPSKGERLDLMMLEKPDGMVLFLHELPNLLSLEIARTGPKPKEEEQRTIPSAKARSESTVEQASSEAEPTTAAGEEESLENR